MGLFRVTVGLAVLPLVSLLFCRGVSVGRGSWVVGPKSWVVGSKSWVVGSGLLIGRDLH